jgi:hypothetical protein
MYTVERMLMRTKVREKKKKIPELISVSHITHYTTYSQSIFRTCTITTVHMQYVGTSTYVLVKLLNK